MPNSATLFDRIDRPRRLPDEVAVSIIGAIEGGQLTARRSASHGDGAVREVRCGPDGCAERRFHCCAMMASWTRAGASVRL